MLYHTRIMQFQHSLESQTLGNFCKLQRKIQNNDFLSNKNRSRDICVACMRKVKVLCKTEINDAIGFN